MWKDGRFLRLVLFIVVTVIRSIECQPWLRQRHPLCVSQFALANRACAHLPIYTVPPPPSGPPPPLSDPPIAPQPPGVPLPPPPTPLAPPVPLPPDPLPPGPSTPLDHPRHHHNDDGQDGDGDGNHHHHYKGGHNHHHGRPYLHGHHHNGSSHHHHHHHHNHDYERRRKVQEDQSANGTPVEQECCHWLEQVDTDCVCDILVNLPPFLSKPLHEYTVIVSLVCNVTYACPSRIRL